MTLLTRSWWSLTQVCRIALLLGTLLTAQRTSAQTVASEAAIEQQARALAALPPMPGPVPLTFPSIHHYERYLQDRLQLLTVREEGLNTLGGRRALRRRKIGSLVGAGLSAGIVSLSLMVLPFTYATDHPSNLRSRRMFGVSIGLFSMTSIGLLVRALRTPAFPHRDEVVELRKQRKAIRVELKRVERER